MSMELFTRIEKLKNYFLNFAAEHYNEALKQVSLISRDIVATKRERERKASQLALSLIFLYHFYEKLKTDLNINSTIAAGRCRKACTRENFPLGLVSSFTSLDSAASQNTKNKIVSLLVKSSLVKLETGFTVL